MNIIGFTFTFNQPGGSGFRINIPSAQQYPPMYSRNEQIHYLKVFHCYVSEVSPKTIKNIEITLIQRKFGLGEMIGC